METLQKSSPKPRVIIERKGPVQEPVKLHPPARINYIGLYKKTYTSKRLLDVVIGSMGLLFFGILYPFIALGIKLSSKGPVLYHQSRTGFRGQPFKCIKFRTMHGVQMESQNGKPIITQKGDERIFWFGQVLRNLNLDELPQLVNVLKGDMSLVGPRPYPVEECGYWHSEFDDHYYRYIVVPGITGYAQANGYRGGTLDTDLMRKRLDYDLIYAERNNFYMDLKIIFKTCLQMLKLNTSGH